jgi:hypothetical protein
MAWNYPYYGIPHGFTVLNNTSDGMGGGRKIGKQNVESLGSGSAYREYASNLNEDMILIICCVLQLRDNLWF